MTDFYYGSGFVAAHPADHFEANQQGQTAGTYEDGVLPTHQALLEDAHPAQNRHQQDQNQRSKTARQEGSQVLPEN